jgi:hypothetical protein
VAGNRTRVNVFLALALPILVIDGFRPLNSAHAWLAEKLHYPLTITGLWQGPWRLFGPDVDKVNLRLSAIVQFADGATATWASPDWPAVSAWRKFIGARHTNYFANILKAGEEPAWDGLCSYLAHSLPHPQGKSVAVVQVTLLLRGADIPDPDKPTPAEPYVAFDEPNPIYQWKPAP